jgi:hypothetical protein
MASRHKVFTKDCSDCPKIKALELDTFLCVWGKGKVSKILEKQKGKKELHCNLKGR